MLQLESRRWLEGEWFACRVLAVLKRSPSTHTHKHMHTNRYPQNVSLCPQHYENHRCLQLPDGCCKWSFSSWGTNVARVTISWRSCDVSFISLPSTRTRCGLLQITSRKKPPAVKCCCFFFWSLFLALHAALWQRHQNCHSLVRFQQCPLQGTAKKTIIIIIIKITIMLITCNQRLEVHGVIHTEFASGHLFSCANRCMMFLKKKSGEY